MIDRIDLGDVTVEEALRAMFSGRALQYGFTVISEQQELFDRLLSHSKLSDDGSTNS